MNGTRGCRLEDPYGLDLPEVPISYEMSPQHVVSAYLFINIYDHVVASIRHLDYGKAK